MASRIGGIGVKGVDSKEDLEGGGGVEGRGSVERGGGIGSKGGVEGIGSVEAIESVEDLEAGAVVNHKGTIDDEGDKWVDAE